MDNKQDVGASACAIPNNQNPRPHAPIFYTAMKVPHPTNSAAKVVHAAAIMSQVMSAK